MKRRVREKLAQSPAVALLGPRQSGKTTLARALGGLYFDLEQAADRTRCDVEWADLTAARSLVIFDEAQAWPPLFPRLRAAIDADRRRRGRFLLLGSVSPALMRDVSESLAGRLALCELAPFSIDELPASKKDEAWLMGGFPDGGILRRRDFPRWQKDYLSLLAQRDLPQWGLPAAPQITDRLFRMLAAGHGQLFNASEIGRGLGLSYHTISHYLEYLVNAYLIRFLPPYAGSLRKRLIRSPKMYWRDSGLLHALMGVADRATLLIQPWLGFSWEGHVIEQILNTLALYEKNVDASFLRTKEGVEADLILNTPRSRWAIEIKLSTDPDPEDLRKLGAAADLVGAQHRVLLSRAERSSEGRNVLVTNLSGLLQRLREDL